MSTRQHRLWLGYSTFTLRRLQSRQPEGDFLSILAFAVTEKPVKFTGGLISSSLTRKSQPQPRTEDAKMRICEHAKLETRNVVADVRKVALLPCEPINI